MYLVAIIVLLLIVLLFLFVLTWYAVNIYNNQINDRNNVEDKTRELTNIILTMEGIDTRDIVALQKPKKKRGLFRRFGTENVNYDESC